MKITSFSVSNFRSITSAHKIDISDNTTILIGKNNEGKSNLLKSIQVAIELIKTYREKPSLLLRQSVYFWERDFPIHLQNRKITQTIFKINFLLDNNEIKEFKEEIGVNLNGILPIEIKISKDNLPKITIKKPGKNTTTSFSRIEKISRFIANKIYFNYIPAIRTDKEILEVVQKMVSQELLSLEKNEEYIKALDSIKLLQQPILERLANQIHEPLSEFLPSIQKVSIEIRDISRKISSKGDINVIIDDGIPTSLEYKGDGIKSLAALGLLKNKSYTTGASVIAIEEPESHLHPGAIHQINDILISLSENNQVILTTHNPLFVNRQNIKSNIIVNNGKATSAKNIKTIRDILGIKTSDNLTNANFALVVEGKEDVKIFQSILPTLNEKISKALKSNLLIIEPIGGAGNLSYKLSLLKSFLCTFHVYLDHDAAGKEAYEKAKKDFLLSDINYTMSICNGMIESEIEDCIDATCYKEAILHNFGVDITKKEFKSNKKWSERIRECFLSSGKTFSNDTLSSVKSVVAEEVSKNPTNSLDNYKKTSIDALVLALEKMLIL